MRKGIFVSYEDFNIFRIYFPFEKKIERIQDITFVKGYQNDPSLYTSANTLLLKENLSSVIPDKSILLISSVNSNYYILSLPIHKSLSAIFSTSSTLSEPLNKNLLEEINQVCWTQYKYRVPNRYGDIAMNMAMSTVVSKEL